MFVRLVAGATETATSAIHAVLIRCDMHLLSEERRTGNRSRVPPGRHEGPSITFRSSLGRIRYFYLRWNVLLGYGTAFCHELVDRFDHRLLVKVAGEDALSEGALQ